MRQGRFKVRHQGVHQRAVVRHFHAQKPVEDVFLPQFSGKCLQRPCITCQRDGFGAVDRRNGYAGLSLYPGRNFSLRQAHGQHRALSCGGGLQPTAVIDHLHRIFQRKRARKVYGGHFSHAVSHNGVRFYAPGSPQRSQSDLDGEDHDLRDFRAVDVDGFS